MRLSRIYALIIAAVGTSPSIMLAKECGRNSSCEFYIAPSGSLIQHNEKSDTVVFKKIKKSSSESIYVDRRGDDYLLVHKSDGNDKSIIVVPLKLEQGNVAFQRVLYFSILMMESTKKGHEVWGGQEYVLNQPKPISEFSWDNANEWQSKVHRGGQSETIEAPKGFQLAKVDVLYSSNQRTDERTYIYPEKFGLTPDNVTCFKNCSPSAENNQTKSYIGSIGPYSVRLNLNSNGSVAKGTYQYEGKEGQLYLTGSFTSSGKISLKEYSDNSMSKQTGSIEAKKIDNSITGTWSAIEKNNQLPFFAIQDTL